jgi:hypothetical protein
MSFKPSLHSQWCCDLIWSWVSVWDTKDDKKMVKIVMSQLPLKVVLKGLIYRWFLVGNQVFLISFNHEGSNIKRKR